MCFGLAAETPSIDMPSVGAQSFELPSVAPSLDSPASIPFDR